jgi:hypothetical protein
MIQLHVLTGGRAGQRHEAKSFPITVGRAPNDTLILSDPGVFERHLEISFSDEGFSLKPRADAVVTLNEARCEGGHLRNGDVIGAGYAKVQFWLAAMPQRGLRLRETVTWALVAGVSLAQLYLLWRLLATAR